MEIAAKRQGEKEILEVMMHIYCRGQKHGRPKGELCEECAALLQYANERTEACPRMENKTFCSKCSSHCYSPQKRGQIRAVMRYAGPRMLLHNPVLVLKHALVKEKDKKKRVAHGQ